MSTLFVLLALLGCLASAAGGAWFARRRQRRAEAVAEAEDLRDTQIRELLAEVKVRAEDARRAEVASEQARERCAALEARIEDLEGRLETARETADHSERLLRDEIDEKSGLRDDLARLRREKDQLETRVQELELELRMAGEGAQLLDPALQMQTS